MGKQHNEFAVVPFPKMRRLEANLARLSRRKNLIRGFVEVDVTRARQWIREQKARTGETFSFTAFIATCLGRAVAEQKEVQASKNWRGQLVLFNDVDISILVEREHEGRKFPVAHIVRAANTKSALAIHQETRAIQRQPMSGKEMKQVQALTRLPSFIRQVFLGVIIKDPHLLKQHMGTVGLTAIGMFGSRGGWGLDTPIHTLGLVLGGIVERPVLIAGQIETHEHLCLTITFDHGIIDGAPAARFVQRLCDLIESGYGLFEDDASACEAWQSPGVPARYGPERK